MTAFLAWYCLLGPAALVGVGAMSSARADAAPQHVARLAFGGALVAMATALVAAVALAAGAGAQSVSFGTGGLGVGIHIDALSATMFLLVSLVGAVVVRYSRNYLDGDPHHGRFLKWLSLTLAAVLTLIVSGNAVQFALAWVATSLCLNRLLVFYPERPAAVLAARKKFVVSRLGDLCLIGALWILYSTFGTLDFAPLFAAAEAVSREAVPAGLHWAAGLLVVAALLKSAQFPLHGWLLEVMETPTPVSALLHAGIINAGGFLVLRFADVIALSPISLEILVVVGGATALFGSVVMLTQTSVKVALAYSTVAQMGFMMLQCGLGAFTAAVLHIVAHSLYKAHAFLSSGSVVELARASWTPSPGGQPHPARMVLAMVLVAAIAVGVSSLFGATLAEKPGQFALGAILLMGLAHLVSSSIDERPNFYVVGRTLALAAIVAVTYFALQRGAELLLAGALPATQPLRGVFDLAMVALVVLSFGTVTVLQSTLAARASTPRWRSLYVHLSHGLYVNTLANRLAIRLWPSPPPAPTAPTVRAASQIGA
jgi:NAD(P)H-quinone oxidoreductase subunit 5